MYGLDLFSGIGGITKALEGYVEPVAYCENERYAQAVLLSRMSTGDIPIAPIWDDVKTLRGTMLPPVEIIYGGFPCQDISIAGRGEGLGGKRSGLFFDIARLVSEIRPRFVFLENVSAITVRGAERVVGELCRLRYDCRWGVLSASDVGANHQRERWWLLAHPMSTRERRNERESKVKSNVVAHPRLLRSQERKVETAGPIKHGQEVPYSGRTGLEGQWEKPIRNGTKLNNAGDNSWWSVEPNVGRVAHGVPFRVDRLRGLGNAVVPAQAREAFERLMGLK